VPPGSAAVHRIASAPPAYVLSHTAGDVARHAALLEPLARSDEVRVVATPGGAASTWHLDIVTRDRPGLLAVFTGVLVQAGIDVTQAVLAGWDDGSALQALVVRAAVPPDVEWLQSALVWSLDQASSAPPVADASITFDRSAAAAYTGCEVVAADRPGLLHAIAVAIVNAGVDIHAAKVSTAGGVARDRFDLTDQRGAKLEPAAERAIAANLRTGFSGTVGWRAANRAG
jgi:[protein-PII] uridylyltransferase